MIKPGIQQELKYIGTDGCYFLSLIAMAEWMENRRVGVVEAYEQATYNNNMTADCYVLDGAAILSDITLDSWTMRWEDASYKYKPQDWVIAEWRWGDKTHFVVDHPFKWSSLSDSQVLKYGYIASKRVYNVNA
jgi:hypothetical protein